MPSHSSHGSFRAQGDVISIRDPAERPSQSASSFDQTFGSSSDSRASWESRESFQWSSVENDNSNENANNRLSTAASIPRPRQDFTPRYPRNNSPSRLAHLASQHTLNSPEFSEFHGSSGEDSLAHTLNSGTGSGSSGPSSGFTGPNRYESNVGFRSIDEEDEGDHTDAEGPAVVSMAERQSFETRTPRPTESYAADRQSHSNFGALGPGGYRQSVADSAFDDADTTEVHGLGYPASSIFGSPGSEATRGVSMISSNPRSSYDPRASTIRAIPEHEIALSPPLPQVGSFAKELRHQPQPRMQHRPNSMTSDGRILACANETFSMHPTINPPPRIALSAATWSSNPPSSYRAEVEGGGSLPTWLHFDARELELWGVPALANAGDVTNLKIVEILPRDKRRSDPSQFGYEPAQERIVGRVIVE
jgi:axial budding pattern protein 2